MDLLLPLQKKLLASRLLQTYLVKCGLRNGVVFYVESLFVLGENTEYFGQGGWWRGKLVLQHIPMFFLQDASREGMPKELLNRLQVWVCPCNSHHYGVTVSKPAYKNVSTRVKCFWNMSEAKNLSAFPVVRIAMEMLHEELSLTTSP